MFTRSYGNPSLVNIYSTFCASLHSWISQRLNLCWSVRSVFQCSSISIHSPANKGLQPHSPTTQLARCGLRQPSYVHGPLSTREKDLITRIRSWLVSETNSLILTGCWPQYSWGKEHKGVWRPIYTHFWMIGQTESDDKQFPNVVGY